MGARGAHGELVRFASVGEAAKNSVQAVLAERLLIRKLMKNTWPSGASIRIQVRGVT
jgi:hypothetical protein